MQKYDDFLSDNEGVIRDISDGMNHVAGNFVLLVYHPESPAIIESPSLDQRIKRISTFLGFDHEQAQASVLEILNVFLCKYVYSYEFEHWLTCQIALIDNNRVIREPIYLITDEEKRLKAANTKGILLDTNKKVISEIITLEKKIFAENEAVKKKNAVAVRKLTVEQMVKKNKTTDTNATD